MKRITLAVALVAALVATAALADQGGQKSAHQGTVKTLTGELVDMGCYLGHAAKGEKHIGCATKCIANGMPMGVLTPDGTLYLVTLNHDNGDPYNKLKDMAGKTVKVTGTVMTRNGVKGIDVTEAAEVTAAVAK